MYNLSMSDYPHMKESFSLYRPYEHAKDGWQVARLRFNEENDGSWFVRSYVDKFNNEERPFNVCAGFEFEDVHDGKGNVISTQIPDMLYLLGNFDPDDPTKSEYFFYCDQGFYSKDHAVEMWKTLVSRGWTSDFDTANDFVDAKYRSAS